MRRKTLGMKIFTVFNYAFLTLLAISCLLPMLNQLAISFSSSSAVAAGEVGLLPVDFTLDSYKDVYKRQGMSERKKSFIFMYRITAWE